jgi:shikimate dehydrogenase
MAARVDGETKVYAVLGHPVHHSLSPAIQNAAFQALGRNAIYLALDVAPERLGEALRGLHACGVRGVNLTAPHKESAWAFLASATDQAERARAVNTLRWEERGWLGHATDGSGFLAWVLALGVPLRAARVLVIGAGGAARSIAPMIASLAPGAIGVVSRDGARAGALASWLSAEAPEGVDVLAAPMADAEAVGRSGVWDVLVRAVAHGPVEGEEREWWNRLAAHAPVLDLNYGSRSREARERAASDGRRYEDGRGLLLYQGALSLEFWIGEPAPLDAMREALTAAG